MAQGVNTVILIGNLGRDPEVRYTQSGSAVCNLRMAITERRKDGEGWRDHTEWVTVVAFGKTAENAGQYLEKGRQIYVDGRLQTRSYKDKEGVEKWSTEVLADRVLFLGGPEGRAGGGRALGPSNNGRAPDEVVPGPSRNPGKDGGFIDDDIPW